MVGFDKGLYVYGLGDLGLKLEQIWCTNYKNMGQVWGRNTWTNTNTSTNTKTSTKTNTNRYTKTNTNTYTSTYTNTDTIMYTVKFDRCQIGAMILFFVGQWETAINCMENVGKPH